MPLKISIANYKEFGSVVQEFATELSKIKNKEDITDLETINQVVSGLQSIIESCSRCSLGDNKKFMDHISDACDEVAKFAEEIKDKSPKEEDSEEESDVNDVQDNWQKEMDIKAAKIKSALRK